MFFPPFWRYCSFSKSLGRKLGSTYSQSTSNLGPMWVSMSMTLYPFFISPSEPKVGLDNLWCSVPRLQNLPPRQHALRPGLAGLSGLRCQFQLDTGSTWEMLWDLIQFSSKVFSYPVIDLKIFAL